jgi:hypothetical protein
LHEATCEACLQPFKKIRAEEDAIRQGTFIQSLAHKTRKNRKFPVGVGDRVSVSGGSGLDSGKSGTIVRHTEVKTDGRGVPINVAGAYKPVNWRKECAVRLDDGSLITMHRDRLSKL